MSGLKDRRIGRGMKACAVSAGMVAAAVGNVMTADAAGAEVYFSELQHNIQGAAAGHLGNVNYANWLVWNVALKRPVAASANEVCHSQYFSMAASLNADYNVYFSVVKTNVATCGNASFGNVLIVNKDVSHTRDTTWAGYRPVGNPQNGWTHVFGDNYNNSEHKRVDCAVIDAGSKFTVCTLHTTAQSGNPDPTWVQLDELKASGMGAPRILMGDFKKFDFSGTKAGVGQVEVMDLADLAPKRAAILDEMNKMKEAEKLDMVVLMLTDVMKEASDLLFVGNDAAAAGFEKAFGGKLANSSIYKEKCLSRKKQVVPPLEGAFKK